MKKRWPVKMIVSAICPNVKKLNNNEIRFIIFYNKNHKEHNFIVKIELAKARPQTLHFS